MLRIFLINDGKLHSCCVDLFALAINDWELRILPDSGRDKKSLNGGDTKRDQTFSQFTPIPWRPNCFHPYLSHFSLTYICTV